MQTKLVFPILVLCLMGFAQTQERPQNELEQLKEEMRILKEQVRALQQEKATNPATEKERSKEAEESIEPELEIKLKDEIKPVKKTETKPSTGIRIEEEFLEEEEKENLFYLRKSDTSQQGLLQQATEKVAGTSVLLSGFFTLEFRKLQSEDSTYRYLPGIGPRSTFNNSHINLYVDAKFLPDFRFFGEFRFVYEPYTTFVEPVGKLSETSEVVIERAWVDWMFRDWLSFRAGNFLVPYGIWNLEHGDPILLATFTPALMRRELFPERATGLQVYGRTALGDFDLLYYAWIGNGKGSHLATEDDQNSKATGGRVEIKFPDFQKLSGIAVGFSYYFGKSKSTEIKDTKILSSIQQIFIAEGNLEALRRLNRNGFDAIGDPLGEFWDHAFGADFRFRFHQFFFQGEIIINNVRPSERVSSPVDEDLDGVPETTVVVTPHFYRQFGAYMQYAYEFDAGSWGLVTPFIRFDWLEGNDRYVRDLSTFTALILGINWKVNRQVVLKTEYHISRFRDAHMRDFHGLYSSLSVSF